jgi:hypothetical protein
MTRKSKIKRIRARSQRGLGGHPPKDKAAESATKNPATPAKVWKNALGKQSLRFIPQTI